MKSSYLEDPLVYGSLFAVPRNWSLELGSASNLLAPVLRPLVPVKRFEFVTSASGDSSLMISQAVVGPLSYFSPLCCEAVFSSNAWTFIIRTYVSSGLIFGLRFSFLGAGLCILAVCDFGGFLAALEFRLAIDNWSRLFCIVFGSC